MRGWRRTRILESDRTERIAPKINKARMVPLNTYNHPAIVLVAAPKKHRANTANNQPLKAGVVQWVSNQSVKFGFPLLIIIIYPPIVIVSHTLKNRS
ncbi:hypothetical protein CWATWH0402_4259 [Crocosphaera watsonii WH 0402]|uniref:Uncharacterized protein n=1 Tax=Crocosphaera watsonii WH 0402 TaxID=1284629 RepID=T2JI79_CROWT|nr:hypothetical protein CWATWH0402_4259 [Crocosphaera watsonii WH 0402]